MVTRTAAMLILSHAEDDWHAELLNQAEMKSVFACLMSFGFSATSNRVFPILPTSMSLFNLFPSQLHFPKMFFPFTDAKPHRVEATFLQGPEM